MRLVLLLGLIAAASASVPVTNWATCYLRGTKSAPNAQGWMSFQRLADDTLNVTYSVSGLTNGAHMFHVHQHGNLASADGSAVGGHFIGTCISCRPLGIPQEVAQLNDGAPIQVAGGVASGQFIERIAKLYGPNSIIGRSIIIHGNGTGTVAGNLVRVAQCVIGRADAAEADSSSVLAPEAPLVTRAGCWLKETSNSPYPVHGFVDIEVLKNVTFVRVVATGFTKGSYHHGYINLKGDISAADGSSTGPMFVGYPAPTYPRTSIGAIGNGYRFIGDSRHSISTSFNDSLAMLNGAWSIIGRSFVLTALSPSTTIVAQCVIGIVQEGWPALPPSGGSDVTQTTRATAVLWPTSLNAVQNLTGYLSFEAQPHLDPLGPGTKVSYFITGLNDGSHVLHVGAVGDVSDAAGANTGADFSDTPLLNHGTPITSKAGVAYGWFVDKNVHLNGPSTVVGRSVTVRGNKGSATAIVAQAVIGKAMEGPHMDAESTQVLQAICVLQPTFVGGNSPAGWFKFTAFPDDPTVGLKVDYSLSGFASGDHQAIVHRFGDLIAWDSAWSDGGDFIGVNADRGFGNPAEVGLMNNGAPITVAAGTASGTFNDSYLALNGLNSLLGRSVVVHSKAPNTQSRDAHCVIGLVSDQQFAPSLYDENLANPPYLDHPTPVYMTISFNSIEQIDGVDQVFTADFYLSLYWYDPRLGPNDEFDETVNWFPALDFINVGSNLPNYLVADPYTYPADVTGFITQPNAFVNDPSRGTQWVSWDQRITGDFTANLLLEAFPFDVQACSLVIESNGWDNSTLKLWPSTPDFLSRIIPDGFQILEWDIVGTSLSDTNQYFAVYQDSYEVWQLSIHLRRQPEYYMYKIVAGVVLLMYMCIAIFMIEVHEADRMMGTTTVFLALITFMFVASSSLPAVSYETKIDKFIFLSFFVTFLIYFAHCGLYYMRPEEDEEEEGEKKESYKSGEVEMQNKPEHHHSHGPKSGDANHGHGHHGVHGDQQHPHGHGHGGEASESAQVVVHTDDGASAAPASPAQGTGTGAEHKGEKVEKKEEEEDLSGLPCPVRFWKSFPEKGLTTQRRLDFWFALAFSLAYGIGVAVILDNPNSNFNVEPVMVYDTAY